MSDHQKTISELNDLFFDKVNRLSKEKKVLPMIVISFGADTGMTLYVDDGLTVKDISDTLQSVLLLVNERREAEKRIILV